jgi:site-specific recombinase XerD
MMAAQGVRVESISAQLGHQKISITQDIYTHVLEGQQDDAAEAAASMLGG